MSAAGSDSDAVADAPDAPDIESLVHEHGDVLYRFALVRVSSPQHAEDLVQDTFLAALSGISRFRGEAKLRTYLIGILKNKIYDHYRKSSREEALEGDAIENLRDGSEASYFTAGGRWRPEYVPHDWSAEANDPAALYERREFLEILRACLEGLAPRAARVFVLREVEEVGGKEVCELLNLSESNVGVILHRTRLQLQQCVGGQWKGSGES
ncbi:MAG: sigma-70 family RNA polymerase sigma factor [bacterium]|nr:sigma-70 family RNA polymerase sigma factor [bacterium]